MARFCFYCGRELATNEKCNCRTHQAGPGPQSTTQPGGQSSTSQTRSDSGQKAYSQTFQGSASQGSAAQQKTRPAWTSWFNQPRARRPASHARRPLNKAAALAFVQQFLRYLSRPVDTIRQAVQAADAGRLVTLLLSHAALGGVAALLLSQLGTLDLLLQLTVAGSADNPALGAIFLTVQGFGLTLVLDLLLIIVTHVALQYVFRTGYSLVRVATSLTPVFFYNILFMILALFSLSAVPISSLMTLVAGLAVSAIALYLALRQLTNFEENRCFMLAVFILLVHTSLIAMLISLATPVLTVLLDQTLPL